MIDASKQWVHIDYLAPNRTYYYEIQAYTYCDDSSGNHVISGSFTGTWRTGADDVQTIAGTVRDANGATDPYYTPVWISCNLGSGVEYNYTATTNAHGYYSIGVPRSDCGEISVSVFNSWCMTTPDGTLGTYPFQYYYATQCSADSGPIWPGHWNFTIMIPARENLNFTLPLNFVGPYVPEELEYTNCSYATLSFTQSVTWTNTYTVDVAGNGGSASYSQSSSYSGGATGQDVETWVKYQTSGFAGFDAMDRTAFQNGSSFYGAIQSSTTENLMSDPQSANSVTQSEAFGNGLWYSFTITPGQTRGGNATISGQVVTNWGANIEVGITISGEGYGVSAGLTASVPVEEEWSTGQSYSNSLSFSIHNGGTTNLDIRAYIEGSSGTTSGYILHVWEL